MSRQSVTLVGFLILALGVCESPLMAQGRLPIIDMHMHARIAVQRSGDGWIVPPPCDPQPCESAPARFTQDEAILTGTLEAMDRHNIVLGFLGDLAARVDRWLDVVPQRSRFIAATFPAGAVEEVDTKIEVLRQRARLGRLQGLGEIGTQYEGIAPNDPRLDAYFRLAEELDIPVLIHTAGLGAHVPSFRTALGSPLLLEDVVLRHPRLRISIENAGYPYLDDAIALMTQYPQVYADVSTITWIVPRSAFYRYLRALVDAGLGKRIMFGSDQMEWPEVIDRAVEAIEEADFLSTEQKRDIFYNNAARFLRLER
ncbi:MAG: amidohydrolase family protein [Dehalococcoidia bacterium]